MTNQELQQLKFPIGTFKAPEIITKKYIDAWLTTLEEFPYKLKALVHTLTEADLALKYRPEAWNIRQVIHHIADSHHHSYIRFKWTLTEQEPTIKAYNEVDWANLHDYNQPIAISLDHINVVHKKLVYLVKGLQEADLDKAFIHPETNTKVQLKENLGIYAWHSEHHYAHIKQALELRF